MHSVKVTVDGIVYPTIAEAAAELDCTQAELSHVFKLCGKTAKVFGKHVEFERTTVDVASLMKSKPIRCVETGKVFPSINEAARRMKCSSQNICSAARRGGRCKGHHWEYA